MDIGAHAVTHGFLGQSAGEDGAVLAAAGRQDIEINPGHLSRTIN
jgi:hypothetical protein